MAAERSIAGAINLSQQTGSQAAVAMSAIRTARHNIRQSTAQCRSGSRNSHVAMRRASASAVCCARAAEDAKWLADGLRAALSSKAVRAAMPQLGGLSRCSAKAAKAASLAAADAEAKLAAVKVHNQRARQQALKSQSELIALTAQVCVRASVGPLSLGFRHAGGDACLPRHQMSDCVGACGPHKIAACGPPS